MKVFYSGVNLYGQFSTACDDLTVKNFSEISLSDNNEEIQFYCIALTYSVFVTSQNIIIRGFFNGRPYQNYKIDFDVHKIKQIACNESHILILSQDGTVWQLNTIGNAKFKPVTKFINTEVIESRGSDSFQDVIAKIYCGKSMNLAVSEQGVLYSIPTKIETEYKVQSMACGQEHGILLSESGQVYTWGTGTRGQLGHDNLDDQIEPRLVEALDGISIIKVAAGGWHSAALSKEGDLYMWGWNANGQLGFFNSNIHQDNEASGPANGKRKSRMNESVSVLTTPRPVNITSNLNVFIVDIACGMRHTIALLDDGSLYGTGLNKYYQLGDQGKDIENICQMTLLKKNLGKKDNVNILCGPYCSAYLLHNE